MAKDTKYRLLFTHPSGRGGSRPFDEHDSTILEESNDMKWSEIEAKINDRSRFVGLWGEQKCAVIRESSKGKLSWVQKVRKEMNK